MLDIGSGTSTDTASPTATVCENIALFGGACAGMREKGSWCPRPDSNRDGPKANGF